MVALGSSEGVWERPCSRWFTDGRTSARTTRNSVLRTLVPLAGSTTFASNGYLPV